MGLKEALRCWGLLFHYLLSFVYRVNLAPDSTEPLREVPDSERCSSRSFTYSTVLASFTALMPGSSHCCGQVVLEHTSRKFNHSFVVPGSFNKLCYKIMIKKEPEGNQSLKGIPATRSIEMGMYGYTDSGSTQVILMWFIPLLAHLTLLSGCSGAHFSQNSSLFPSSSIHHWHLVFGYIRQVFY